MEIRTHKNGLQSKIVPANQETDVRYRMEFGYWLFLRPADQPFSSSWSRLFHRHSEKECLNYARKACYTCRGTGAWKDSILGIPCDVCGGTGIIKTKKEVAT